jgi:hypothetical protein
MKISFIFFGKRKEKLKNLFKKKSNGKRFSSHEQYGVLLRTKNP